MNRKHAQILVIDAETNQVTRSFLNIVSEQTGKTLLKRYASFKQALDLVKMGDLMLLGTHHPVTYKEMENHSAITVKSSYPIPQHQGRMDLLKLCISQDPENYNFVYLNDPQGILGKQEGSCQGWFTDTLTGQFFSSGALHPLHELVTQ